MIRSVVEAVWTLKRTDAMSSEVGFVDVGMYVVLSRGTYSHHTHSTPFLPELTMLFLQLALHRSLELRSALQFADVDTPPARSREGRC